MKIYKCLLALAVAGLPVKTVFAENEPWPTSVGDSVTLTADQRVYLPVLDNDIGIELVLFDVNTTTSKLGSVEMDTDKTGVFYQSADGFTGEDSFWYAFEDNLGRTNAAQVIVTVLEPTPVNPPEEVEEDLYLGWPVATPDNVTALKDESVVIAVLENDNGLELGLTDVNEVTVSNGSAAIIEDKIEYTPYQGFIGEDSFWYQFTDARGRANSTQVKITVSEEDIVVPPVEPPTPEVPEPDVTFSNVEMHYNLLQAQSQIFGETGGNYFMSLAEPASSGSTSLLLADDYEIKDGQLITYLSTDGEYYTLATDTLDGRVLSLKQPLPADTADNIWNFYDNAAHPNWYGYLSVADFAVRELSVDVLNSGKHLMLGDSWFQSGGIEQRLKERLPDAEISNKGVGGRTAGEILVEFDTDIEGQSPDFVWLIAGTNDYFQDVSLETYTENMRSIIEKINDSGAKAIVIDSSVAPKMHGSDVLTELSHEYSNAVGSLLVSEN
jgi:hypothetical protein